MGRLVVACLLACSVLLAPVTAQEKPDVSLTGLAVRAVALLYSQDAEGGMRMRCTATAFDKTRKGYKFISAAHCIGEDNRDKERAASGENIPFFVTFDETKTVKKFHPASVEWVGYQHRGEDFAEFAVATEEQWAAIPLGDEKDLQAGAKIVNVASPLGLGIQVIGGTISSVFLDRPVVQGDINWKGSMLLSLATVGGGSSGSAVISEEQRAIVGFLVGTIGANNIVAIPVSKFKAVRKAVEAGTYKYWPKPDA